MNSHLTSHTYCSQDPLTRIYSAYGFPEASQTGKHEKSSYVTFMYRTVGMASGCDSWPGADPAAAQRGAVISTAVAVLDGERHEEMLQALSLKWIFHPPASSWNTVLDAAKKNESLAVRSFSHLHLSHFCV